MNLEKEAISFCRHHPNTSRIEIWQPRYSTREVLIHKLKIRDHNIIAITKANSLNGLYYISGKKVKKCRKDSNGKALMYAVPMDELVPFKFDDKCMHIY